MTNSAGGNAGSAPPAGGKASDLRIRFLSALVLGPATLLVVWIGGWAFLILVGAGAALSAHEWQKMVAGRDVPQAVRLSGCAASVAALAVLAVWGVAAGVAAMVLGGAVLAVAVGRRHWLAALAVPYSVAGLGAMVILRLPEFGGGLDLFLYLLLAVWACDIGAYAAGRAIGGPKLAPRISPSKTWAGLAGGAVSSALVGAGFWLAGANGPAAAAIGVLLALSAQAGDLLESALKRQCRVKDSGHLIPGHGGVLDRIDGLMVAAPVLALFHAAIGMSLPW